MTCRPSRPATREHQSPGEAAYVNSIYPIDIGDMRCLRHALMVAAGVISGNYAIKSLNHQLSGGRTVSLLRWLFEPPATSKGGAQGRISEGDGREVSPDEFPVPPGAGFTLLLRRREAIRVEQRADVRRRLVREVMLQIGSFHV